jgi:hypothetical protein
MSFLRWIAGLLAVCVIPAATAVEYVPDATFNAGRYLVDAFSGPDTRWYQGQRIARLPGGGYVVAAMVPRRDAGAYAVGLVRYDASGVRQSWANPGVYGVSDKQYVIYDPLNVTLRHVAGIADLVVANGRLFVLANVQPGDPEDELSWPPMISIGTAVDILVFDLDGAFLGYTEVMPRIPGTSYFAGGIALYVPDLTVLPPRPLHLVYGGTTDQVGSGQRADFVRYVVGSAATLTRIVTAQPDPGGLCSGMQRCQARDIALGGRASLSKPPRIYLGGMRQNDTGAEDFLAMRVAPDGVPVAAFGSGGAVIVDFPRTGFDPDRGRLIAVGSGSGVGSGNNDAIYLAGETVGLCSGGAALVKIRPDGTLDPSFGSSGNGTVSWFMPGATPELLPCSGPRGGLRLRDASDIVVKDGEVALVSQVEFEWVPGTDFTTETLLTVFDAATGARKANSFVPYSESGARARHSGSGGLVADGGGSYTVTGHVRYFGATPWGMHGRYQVATLRLVPE